MRWEQQSQTNFTLYDGGQLIGEMKMDYATLQQQAQCTMNGQQFIIRRTGFWKTGVEMVETGSDKMLLQAAPKKWYSNRLDVSAEGENVELKIWNNPLAEWALEKDGQTVLAYGLSTDEGRAGVRIRAAMDHVSLHYHFLLWYLFFPVALENGGSDLPFYFLLSQ